MSYYSCDAHMLINFFSACALNALYINHIYCIVKYPLKPMSSTPWNIKICLADMPDGEDTYIFYGGLMCAKEFKLSHVDDTWCI